MDIKLQPFATSSATDCWTGCWGPLPRGRQGLWPFHAARQGIRRQGHRMQTSRAAGLVIRMAWKLLQTNEVRAASVVGEARRRVTLLQSSDASAGLVRLFRRPSKKPAASSCAERALPAELSSVCVRYGQLACCCCLARCWHLHCACCCSSVVSSCRFRRRKQQPSQCGPFPASTLTAPGKGYCALTWTSLASRCTAKLKLLWDQEGVETRAESDRQRSTPRNRSRACKGPAGKCFLRRYVFGSSRYPSSALLSKQNREQHHQHD
jgi:hypothetical protein